nr:hypothetical protein [Streptomyces sp. RPA4-2]
MQRAARLARLGTDAAARACSALDAAGLVTGARLRHPAAESAVLGMLSCEQRRSMHRNAARVLHHALAEPAVVAGQLLAAGTATHSWEIQALRDAARQEPFSPGDPDGAPTFLRLARSGCPDEPTRLRITLQLAAHTWRLHPAAAHHLLDEPQAALRAGRLPCADAGWLARLLAAQGRVEEADEVLGRAAGDVRPARDSVPSEPHAQCPVTHERPSAPVTRAATLWLSPGAREDVPAAERLLTDTPLAPATYESLARALRILVHHRPQRAVAWCGRLAEEISARDAPGWQAAFATAHAESLLRLGDLAGARREATRALEHLAAAARSSSPRSPCWSRPSPNRASTPRRPCTCTPPCPASRTPLCTPSPSCAPAAATTWPPGAPRRPSRSSWRRAGPRPAGRPTSPNRCPGAPTRRRRCSCSGAPARHRPWSPTSSPSRQPPGRGCAG